MPINLHQFDHRESMLDALYQDFTDAIEAALA